MLSFLVFNKTAEGEEAGRVRGGLGEGEKGS